MKEPLQIKSHQTHRESLWRFVLLAALLVAYFVYMSFKYGAATGALVSALSWSFFVLCTPVADGGFVIAFPIRLLFGVRMLVTQIVVWFVAIGINLAAMAWSPASYEVTPLTKLLHTIFTTPWPDWSILLIALGGTIMSIWFGDEMIDVASHSMRKKGHKHGFKHKTIVVLGLGVLTVIAYYNLLSHLDISIPTG